MQVLTDMLGYEIKLPNIPQRIVSLVPSQTELLYDLGLEQNVVGITKFCIHPEHWFRSKQKIGGTKTIHIDKVQALQPDLIIANKEENTLEQVVLLRDIAPVWTSDINNIVSSLQMIQAIGELTNTVTKATEIINNINEGINFLPPTIFKGKKVAYFIWKDPWMSIGSDTFIHDVLTYLGAINIFENQNRYPVVSIEDTIAIADYILLSSEPFPFQQKHIDWFIETYPQIEAKILIVDGEMFSWYGSRMQLAFPYFKQLATQL